MLVLDADLHTSSKAGYFKAAYPDRFLQVGIAEQNLFGISAGLALEGFIPFPVHFCGLCDPACPGPDCHLDLLPRLERQDPRFVCWPADQPGRRLAQLHRRYRRDACPAEHARG